MSGKMTERRRRKMMREMRLAGYELPETPYRRVNRCYNKKGKTGVSTKKVRTSKKVVTGKRLAYVRMFRYMSDAQRKAMFAKMQQNGTYDPRPFLNGRKPTKEERKWIRWQAGGKVGPSPYDKEHAHDVHAQRSSLDDEYKKTLAIKSRIMEDHNIILHDVAEPMGSCDPSKDRRLKGSYFDPKSWPPAQYKEAKKIAIMSFELKNEPIPPEDSPAFQREMLIIDGSAIYANYHPRSVKEAEDVYKRLGLSDEIASATVKLDLRNRVIEKMSHGIMMDKNGQALDVTKSTFVRYAPQAGRTEGTLPFIKKQSKKERDAEKAEQREQKRQKHLAEENQRRQDLAERERERALQPKPAPAPYIPPAPAPKTELPQSLKDQIAREKAAKKKKDKWHDTRVKKSYRRLPATRTKKAASSIWGDLIEKQRRPVRRSRAGKAPSKKPFKSTPTKIYEMTKQQAAELKSYNPHTKSGKRKAAKKGKDIWDTLESTVGRAGTRLEKTWKERAKKRAAYKKTQEYKDKQAKRKAELEATKKDLKERTRKFEGDVKKGAHELKERSTAEAYDTHGKPMNKKPKSAWDPAYRKPESESESTDED